MERLLPNTDRTRLLLNPLTAGQTEEVMHWLHEVSELVAIKTTEGPHYRRLAMQRERAGSGPTEDFQNPAAVDQAFPVGELREQLRADTARVLTGQEPRRRSSRPPIDVNSGKGFAFIDHVGTVYRAGSCRCRWGRCANSPSSTSTETLR